MAHSTEIMWSTGSRPLNNDSQRIPNLERARAPSAFDVIDRILDKGVVVEYRMTRVSLGGIDLPATVEARGVIITSLDTYLTVAEPPGTSGLPGDAPPGNPTAAPAHSRHARHG